MQCIGCELEPATRTQCRFQLKTIAEGSYALLDVLQVFLEHPYREAKIVTQIVEGPLLGTQSLDDFLAAGMFHLSAFSANHWWIGTSSTNSSSITPTPSRTRTLTEASRWPRRPLHTARSAFGARSSSM